MTPDQISQSLLWQVPLASLVVFLTIRFLSHLEKTGKDNLNVIKEMNEENQKAETERQAKVLEFIAHQEEVNQEFLRIQREQMNESIGRLAEEIKSNKTEMLRETATVINLIDKLLDRISEITERLRHIQIKDSQSNHSSRKI